MQYCVWKGSGDVSPGAAYRRVFGAEIVDQFLLVRTFIKFGVFECQGKSTQRRI